MVVPLVDLQVVCITGSGLAPFNSQSRQSQKQGSGAIYHAVRGCELPRIIKFCHDNATGGDATLVATQHVYDRWLCSVHHGNSATRYVPSLCSASVYAGWKELGQD
jgi:hypothetical protein